MVDQKIIIEELNFLHNVILATSNKTFSVKQWSITFLVAYVGFFITLFTANNEIALKWGLFLFIGILGVCGFWVLDAYFYSIGERLRRRLTYVVSFLPNNKEPLEKMELTYFKWNQTENKNTNKMSDFFQAFRSLNCFAFYSVLIIFCTISVVTIRIVFG